MWNKQNKIFEAKISVPGDSFVVKKVCKTFEEGADSAVNTLGRQLKKRKEKAATLSVTQRLQSESGG